METYPGHIDAEGYLPAHLLGMKIYVLQKNTNHNMFTFPPHSIYSWIHKINKEVTTNKTARRPSPFYGPVPESEGKG